MRQEKPLNNATRLTLAIGLQPASWRRRWNEKLEEVEVVKQRLTSLDVQRYWLSTEEEERIRSMELTVLLRFGKTVIVPRNTQEE